MSISRPPLVSAGQSRHHGFDLRRPRRRQLFSLALGGGLGLIERPRAHAAPAGFPSPASIYINWGAYDELSDDVPLTETLAMAQLEHLLRLRKRGARFDYYLMDCFWFDQQGGYRTWRKPNFPRGPQRWLERCRQQGVLPGLWIGTNASWGQNPKPVLEAWKRSYDPRVSALAMFAGGFMDDLLAALQHWYDHGVRLFKFDFANFAAAPDDVRAVMTESEIRALNAEAFRAALGRFRMRNPELVTLAYNGFGGAHENTIAPSHQSWDQRWLRVFDALYCGDPRFSDVPMWNHWRSMDLFSDHMVRRFYEDGVPLERIDSSSFMIAPTGTGYRRGKQAFRGMLVLALARGGHANTYYGDLGLLDERDADFFARAQRLFLPLQALGRSFVFGPLPGTAAAPYGFVNADGGGVLYTVVNPTQTMASAALPQVSAFQQESRDGRVLFHDAGFTPTLSGNQLTLGPEQLAVAGFGRFADERFALGEEPDVNIPTAITPLRAALSNPGDRTTLARVEVPAGHDVRLLVQQRNDQGGAQRSSGGAPPKGTPLDRIIRLEARQGERTLPIEVRHAMPIWSGLSWAVARLPAAAIGAGQPLVLSASSTDAQVKTLEARVFAVRG